MANFSKILLSASDNGRNIQLLTTGFNILTTGQLIHSGVFGTSSLDEVYLYASNRAVTDTMLIIQWGYGGGGITSGDCFHTVVPAQNGRVLIADGKLINNGLQIYGLISGSNVAASGGVSIDGYVNRLS